MLTAIVVAAIGAFGTVLAAMVTTLQRRQAEFRQESSDQHGVLMGLVKNIDKRTMDTSITVKVLTHQMQDHLASHGEQPAEVSTTEKAPRKRTTVRK
jgi:hypothetical protein